MRKWKKHTISNTKPAPAENSDAQEGENAHESEVESSAELELEETHDQLHNGVHLVLAYNEEAHAFVGVISNTTEGMLEQVRVEVHLSSGKELGPTAPFDLDTGESHEIYLSAASEEFFTWTAQAEVGREDQGHEGDPETS